jgi:isopropylmalate/homocitrate/citramalate synthase
VGCAVGSDTCGFDAGVAYEDGCSGGLGCGMHHAVMSVMFMCVFMKADLPGLGSGSRIVPGGQ